MSSASPAGQDVSLFLRTMMLVMGKGYALTAIYALLTELVLIVKKIHTHL